MIATLKTVSAIASVVAVLTFGGDDAADKAASLAREALGRQLKAVVDSTALVDVTSTSWPDSSLGCPQPGMMYTPALVSGHLVHLRMNNVVYAVHVGGGQAVVCQPNASAERDNPEPSSRSKRDSGANVALGFRLAEQARTTLATRLKVPRDRVTIESYRATTWPDVNLGCPNVGDVKPQPTRGFLIQLRVGRDSYPFHSDLERVVECPPRP